MLTFTSDPITTSHRESGADSPADEVARLLIIDNHPGPLLAQLQEGCWASGYRAKTARTGQAAIESINDDPPKVILLEPQLPDRSGLEVFQEIRRIAPDIPVIFVSAAQSANLAIEAIKHGAYDYLFKPVEARHLMRVITAALELVPQAHPALASAAVPWTSQADGELCGGCPKMREVYKAIGLVAAQDVNVLITGESGTGKELVARAIYRHSARSEAPFLTLNCAAIPDALLESELFGHEKGAFSGAERRRIGKFEQCDGGTIVLDEIGDMPLALQAKILRLLQEQTFERVGGNETIRTNVRLIASTHRDLKALSAAGKFRADLYYRLNVFSIHLPPLRERGADVEMLVQHYLRRFSRELGREVRQIAPAALERLCAYSWPGNIREVQSILKQALLQASGSVLLPAFLPEMLGGAGDAVHAPPQNAELGLGALIQQRLTADASDLYAEIHREVDRICLTLVLDHVQGRQHQAARLLGIARQTLRVKLRELGLRVTHSVEAGVG